MSLFSLQKKNNLAFLAILNAPSEETDQAARMRRLIWIFAGRLCPKVRFLTLFLSYLRWTLLNGKQLFWYNTESSESLFLPYPRYIC